MSRTYKDRPYWVKAQDPSMVRHARHFDVQDNHSRFSRKIDFICDGENCDLDEVAHSRLEAWRKNCRYEVPRYADGIGYSCCRLCYWRPNRHGGSTTVARAMLATARNLYNNGVDLEDEGFDFWVVPKPVIED